MKKLAIALFVLTFVSCRNNPLDPPYKDAPTQFVVTDVSTKDGMRNMATYYVEVVDANGLSYDSNNNRNLMFWFSDSVGKYRAGETINFNKR